MTSLLEFAVGVIALDQLEIPGQNVIQVRLFEKFDKLHRVRMTDHPGAGLLVDDLDQHVDVVGYSARSFENADQVCLVVRNREFAKRARPASHDDHRVATANVFDLAAHETAACVNNDVVAAGR